MGGGEFLDQETYSDRIILVRFMVGDHSEPLILNSRCPGWPQELGSELDYGSDAGAVIGIQHSALIHAD
jgi:hypothetical protein